jgi:hypothetical protein
MLRNLVTDMLRCILLARDYTMNWTTNESWFGSQQRHETSVYFETSRPAVQSTQTPVQLVSRFFFFHRFVAESV